MEDKSYNPTHLYKVEIIDHVPTVVEKNILSYTPSRFYISEIRLHGKKDVDYVVACMLGAPHPLSAVFFSTAEEAAADWKTRAVAAIVEARALTSLLLNIGLYVTETGSLDLVLPVKEPEWEKKPDATKVKQPKKAAKSKS